MTKINLLNQGLDVYCVTKRGKLLFIDDSHFGEFVKYSHRGANFFSISPYLSPHFFYLPLEIVNFFRFFFLFRICFWGRCYIHLPVEFIVHISYFVCLVYYTVYFCYRPVQYMLFDFVYWYGKNIHTFFFVFHVVLFYFYIFFSHPDSFHVADGFF